MHNRLGYFTLETPNIDKAQAFYTALFGWTFEAQASQPSYAHVRSGGFAVDGAAFGIVKGEKKDFSNLYFRVDDIDAACARVVELGGKAAMPSDSESGRSVTVCDDQGVSFGLWRPGSGIAD